MMPDDVGIRQSALYFQIKRHSRVIRRTQTHTDTQCVRVYVNVYVHICVYGNVAQMSVGSSTSYLPLPPSSSVRISHLFIELTAASS